MWSLLFVLTSKLSTLSLHVYVQKSYNIAFSHGDKKVLTSLTINTQPMRQVMETTYLGVVLTDDLSCVKNVERAKLTFFETIQPYLSQIYFYW